MRTKNGYRSCLPEQLTSLSLILLIAESSAQPAGITKSPWIDTSPDVTYTYVAALQIAPSVIKDPDDLLVLKEADERLARSDDRAREYRAGLCADFKRDNADLGNADLASYGYDFNQVDALIAEDTLLVFKEILSKLSTEGAESLNQIRENMTSSSSRIDWQKYAELAPEQMRKAILDSCP